MKCPNCGCDGPDGAFECRKCSIIFDRWKKLEPGRRSFCGVHMDVFSDVAERKRRRVVVLICGLCVCALAALVIGGIRLAKMAAARIEFTSAGIASKASTAGGDRRVASEMAVMIKNWAETLIQDLGGQATAAVQVDLPVFDPPPAAQIPDMDQFRCKMSAPEVQAAVQNAARQAQQNALINRQLMPVAHVPLPYQPPPQARR